MVGMSTGIERPIIRCPDEEMGIIGIVKCNNKNAPYFYCHSCRYSDQCPRGMK